MSKTIHKHERGRDMRSKKFGRGDYGCRGCQEKWLFTNEDTRLSVFKCVEFIEGEKCVWLECRAYYDGGYDVLVSADASEGWIVFDRANGRRRG